MFLWNPELLEGFFLAFLRCSTALVLMPIFGFNGIPNQIKAGLALILAIIMAPEASQNLFNAPPGVMAMATVAISEVLVGLVFGMVTTLILVSAEFAGTIVGMQMGFAIVNLFDPQLGQVALIGRYQYFVAMIIFLCLDMHLPFLRALGDSFVLIPLGSALFQDAIAMQYARLSAQVFVIAIKIAAPVMAMMFITELTLGVIARVVPQMNVFIVGFPLKIGVGMYGLVITGPLFVFVIAKVFRGYEHELRTIMILLSGS